MFRRRSCEGWLFLRCPRGKLLPPKTAKGGTRKEIEMKSLGWWKAQCNFRGLNQIGAINDLQLCLREAKKNMLPELKVLETELNKAARDGSWGSLKSVEQKAKTDPSRFLAEAFPKGATGRPANLHIVVLKIGVDDGFTVAAAAEAVGLETVSVDTP